MSRTLKLFLLVLGLGIFTLPKQMVFAQNMTECCDQKATSENCCASKSTDSCHSETSDKNSQKENCGDDCTNCHSCTVHFAVNYISPELSAGLNQHKFATELNFGEGISFISSSIQNIWQPPKIG